MADIATKKIFKNGKIAVWEMVLEPGQISGLHTHSYSYVLYVLESATCEVTDKDRTSCGALSMEPRFTMVFRLENKELVAGDFRIRAVRIVKLN